MINKKNVKPEALSNKGMHWKHVDGKRVYYRESE